LNSFPDAPHKIPTAKPKSCGRVLTSQENMDMITEKVEAKRQVEKERRKLEREAKRLEKQGYVILCCMHE